MSYKDCEAPTHEHRQLRSANPTAVVLRRSLSDLRGTAFILAGAPLAGRIVLLDALRRPRARLSRHDNVQFRQEGRVQAEIRRFTLYEHHTTSLVFNDPPLHTRVRKIIAGALTPRAIADVEAALVVVVDGLLDRIASKGRADLVAPISGRSRQRRVDAARGSGAGRFATHRNRIAPELYFHSQRRP